MAIGEIEFDGQKAILGDDGKWKCEDAEIQEYLNDEYALEGWWVSPAMGAPGAALLHEAARELGGKARYLKPIEENREGAIY